MPLNILYSFPHRIGVTGIGNTAWHQVKGLVDLGANVTLACGSCEKPIPGLHRMIQTMRLGAFKLPYKLFGHERAYRFHDRATARLVRRMSAEIDLVHCWPLGSLETLQACHERGVTSMLERPNTHTGFAYEVVAKEHEKLGLAVMNGYTHAYSSRRLAREEAEYALADKLACPSDFVAHTFLERGFPLSRISRHQYGYHGERFHIENAQQRRSGLVMLFVGRCEPRKGLHYALQAWHASGAAETGKFIICGDYVAGYRDVIRPMLDHPSVEERGFVRDVEMLMQQADVFVLPSIEEGSALVTYEARACGCVLLVSDAAGAVGADGVELLLHQPGNVQQLTDQIRMLNLDKARLQQIRRQSLLANATLTWAHASGMLLERYQEAIDQRSSKAVPVCQELPVKLCSKLA